MKRFLILLAGLALLCCCAAAEGPGQIMTDFEDFTLSTPAAPAYAAEKADGLPVFLYYLSMEGNVSTTAVNAIWSQSNDPLTAEQFTEICRGMEEAVRAQYELSGLRLNSYEAREAVERELWNRAALVCDTEMLVNVNGTEVPLQQRIIQITGSFGTYRFSMSAWSADLLEEATESLALALQWK